jgi:hypothetical protein
MQPVLEAVDRVPLKRSRSCPSIHDSSPRATLEEESTQPVHRDPVALNDSVPGW